jgi:hypothetical protein
MAAKTPKNGRYDLAGEDAAQVSAPGTAAPQVAGVAGALATAIVIQRRNEAKRSRLQQWVGALPRQQTREEMTVRTGALVAGALAHVLVAGAMTGVQRYRDRKARIDDSRMIYQIVGVAARASDGSIPADSRVVLESALKGTGLGGRVRKRLLAEPIPMAFGDLEPYSLHGELLEAVPMIAFSAMAETTGPDEAARRIPSLLRRIGLPRPTAEAMAARLIEEYNSQHMILSDYYARLGFPAPERSIQLHLPISQIAAVTESVVARNPNEIARQATRQALTTLIQRGIRATLGSGVRLNPAALTAIRVVGQFFGEEVPAWPANITSSQRGGAKSIASARTAKSPEEPK